MGLIRDDGCSKATQAILEKKKHRACAFQYSPLIQENRRGMTRKERYVALALDTSVGEIGSVWWGLHQLPLLSLHCQ